MEIDECAVRSLDLAGLGSVDPYRYVRRACLARHRRIPYLHGNGRLRALHGRGELGGLPAEHHGIVVRERGKHLHDRGELWIRGIAHDGLLGCRTRHRKVTRPTFHDIRWLAT